MLKNNFKIYYSSKKSLIGLNYLIGIILSTVALVFAIKIIYSMLLSTPINRDIAQDNAESIQNFIDSSIEKYSGEVDCYTSLRLTNLENFQNSENNDNYYLIIDKDSIGIIPSDRIDTFYKNNNIKSVQISNVDLNNEIKFIDDKTSSSVLGVDIYFFNIGGTDSNLQLEENNNLAYLQLFPKLDYDFIKDGTDVFSYKQNKFNLFNLILKDDEISTDSKDGNFLILNPSKKELFLANSEHTEFFANYKNCALDKLRFEEYKDFVYSKPKFVDFINNEITFDFYDVDLKKNMGYEVIWNVEDEIKCINFNCDNYFEKKISYSNFLNKLSNLYMNLDELEQIGNGDLKIIDIKQIKVSSDTLNNKNLYYDLDKLFVKYDSLDIDYSLKKDSEIEDYLSENFEDKTFDDLFEDYNICDSLYCKYGFLDKSIYYFYSGDLNSFVSLNTDYFYKTQNNQLYYRGEFISPKKVKADEVGITVFGENKIVYIFEIDISKNKKQPVLLSSYQLNKIKKISNEFGGLQK